VVIGALSNKFIQTSNALKGVGGEDFFAMSQTKLPKLPDSYDYNPLRCCGCMCLESTRFRNTLEGLVVRISMLSLRIL
jgi:hypothetical protein